MRRFGIGVILIVTCIPAWGMELRLPPGKWWQNEKVVQQIQLTEEQQNKIHAMVLDHARRMIDLSADVKRAELDLRELADQTQFDVAKVRDAYLKFQQARQVLDTERFELLLLIRQVLSSEQWKKLSEMQAQLQRRRGDRPRPGDQSIRPRGNPRGGPGRN